MEDISASLTDLATRELTMLKDLKVRICCSFYPILKLLLLLLLLLLTCLVVFGVMRNQKKEEGELPFGIEDLLYYVKRIEEMQFNLDFGVLKQYFPVDLVLSGIFKIIQDVFGIHILFTMVEFVVFS